MTLTDSLSVLYSDIQGEGSFGRASVLYNAAKNTGLNVTLKQVKDFLKTKSSHTEFRPLRKRNFIRNKLVPNALHESWFADLAVLPPELQTGRNKFILVVSDALSRQIYAKMLTSKKANAVASALQEIFDEVGFKPGTLISDAGTEFVNATMREVLERNHVSFRPASRTHSSKSFLAEWAIKELMRRVYRVLKERGSRKLNTELLSQITRGLNARKMRSLGNRAPDEITVENQREVAQEQRKEAESFGQVKPKFAVGTLVMTRNMPTAFEKAYKGTVKPEVFVIDAIISRKGGLPTFRLRDKFGSKVLGQWYADQLVESVEGVHE